VTIIPGVELNNLAGNEGIHLIALFDLDMTANDVDHFLSSIGSLKGTGANVTRGLPLSASWKCSKRSRTAAASPC
jgi:hypothetical protein